MHIPPPPAHTLFKSLPPLHCNVDDLVLSVCVWFGKDLTRYFERIKFIIIIIVKEK